MAEREGTPDRVESIRRQLKRYLSPTGPVQPTVSTRHAIEDALGLDRDALADDEEDSLVPMSAEQHALGLVEALRAELHRERVSV